MEHVNPEEVGMSSERLHHLAALVESWVEEGHMLGASYMIVRKGNIVAHEVFGLAANEPEPVPVTKDTIFGLLSLTKMATGVAVMTLLDRGELLPDDTINYLLPDYSANGKGLITVKQLLTHSSGLGWSPDFEQHVDFMIREVSEDEWKQAAREATLKFVPGTAIEYSARYSSGILKWMVEKLSGLEWEEYCQKNVFRPLGMKDTSWRPDRKVWPRIAWVQDPSGQPFSIGAALANSEYARSRATLANGTLFSTPYDIARLMQMLLNGGELEGYRLLSPAMSSLGTSSHTDSLPFNPMPPVAQGLSGAWTMAPADMGFHIAVRRHRRGGFLYHVWGDMTSPSSFGFMGGNNTWAWADPEKELICVFLCNTLASLPEAGRQRRRHQAILANTVVAALLEDK